MELASCAGWQAPCSCGGAPPACPVGTCERSAGTPPSPPTRRDGSQPRCRRPPVLQEQRDRALAQSAGGTSAGGSRGTRCRTGAHTGGKLAAPTALLPPVSARRYVQVLAMGVSLCRSCAGAPRACPAGTCGHSAGRPPSPPTHRTGQPPRCRRRPVLREPRGRALAQSAAGTSAGGSRGRRCRTVSRTGGTASPGKRRLVLGWCALG